MFGPHQQFSLNEYPNFVSYLSNGQVWGPSNKRGLPSEPLHPANVIG